MPRPEGESPGAEWRHSRLRSAADRVGGPRAAEALFELLDSVGDRARAAGDALRGRHEPVRDEATRPGSVAADLLADAARNPDTTPGLSALMAAGRQVFVDPEASWDAGELEALARARVDEEMYEQARASVARRAANLASVVGTARGSGTVDPQVSDEAVVHLSLALSAGLALIAPVMPTRTTPEEWDVIQSRIGVALAPPEMLLEVPVEATHRWRARIDVPHRPGSSARVARALAALHANSTYFQVAGIEGDVRTIEIGLLAPQSVTAEMVESALAAVGSNVHTTPGRAEDGQDLLTRSLDAAAYLVRHPEAAPRIAAELVVADDYEVIDATEGVSDETDVLRLQWTTNRHVLLYRTWAPFARAEQARASALLRLADATAHLSGDAGGDAGGWVDPIRGGTVWIRRARPEDADQVAAMHERISEQSHYQRYFAHTQWKDLQLRRLAGGHRGATLVAQSRDGQLIALGNVFPQQEGSSTAEIAVLVEDRFQGRGLGRVMLRRMIQVAVAMGFEELLAEVLAENKGMQRLLDSMGLKWSSHTSEGVRSMRARLPRTEGDGEPVAG